MRWSADGERVFLIVGDDEPKMTMRAFGSDGSLGPVQELFPYPYFLQTTLNYDISVDDRFVVIQADEPPTLLFTDNWFEELERLVPTD